LPLVIVLIWQLAWRHRLRVRARAAGTSDVGAGGRNSCSRGTGPQHLGQLLAREPIGLLIGGSIGFS